MTEYENACVGCDYCVNCGATHTPYTVCDECGEDCRECGDSVYIYDGKELCEGCAQETVNALWAELTVLEKLEALCWDRDEFNSTEGAEAAADEWFAQATLEEQVDIFEEIEEER